MGTRARRARPPRERGAVELGFTGVVHWEHGVEQALLDPAQPVLVVRECRFALRSHRGARAQAEVPSASRPAPATDRAMSSRRSRDR